MKRAWTRSEKLLFATPLLSLGFSAIMIYAPDGGRSIEALFETVGLSTRNKASRSSCQSNLKQMGLGVLQYVRDYDEKFPLVTASTRGFGGYGWGDILQPYLKSTFIYQCPSEPNGAALSPASFGYTDYYYNARLARTSIGKHENPARTLLFGEGQLGNARYAKTALTSQWLNGKNSPARRHYAHKSAIDDGSNVAFADGHIKWLRPTEIGTDWVGRSGFTFRFD